MAKLTVQFTPPGGLDYRGNWQAQEKEFLDTLRANLRARDSSPLVGEELRWQRGDGYARYVVIRERPFEIGHLNIHDGYQVEPELIRGLRLSDAREMIEADKRIAALFARKPATEAKETT